MKRSDIKTNRVIQTDQRTCFDENGTEIPCDGTGQDGDLRCGRPWPMPRFSRKEDLVKDLLSGLTWTRDASICGYPLTWHEAQARIEEMNRNRTFGFADWRMPYRDELFGIVSHTHVNPSLPDVHPFVNVFSGYFWTGTPCARLPDQAWYVHLGGARVQRGLKEGSYMVWPVRGENSLAQTVMDDDRFESLGKVVLDRSTGLRWTRDADVKGRPVRWAEAVNGVGRLNATHAHDGDWRLPNIRELAGLLDVNRHAPALSRNHPFVNLRQAYWSGTTSTYEPRYAWVVEMRDGAVGVGFKPLREFHAWYVRSEAEKEARTIC